ncbi:MAG: hydrogenase maturation protease [Planctomycetes bacterium]|nr:hydrogenase maturation protease [Planctomycetota bacterium]
MSSPVRFLVIGYGNPGRLDDGLGPALAESLDLAGSPGLTIDADYQLTVEDAAAAAEHDVVVFADASLSGPEPFFVERVKGRSDLGFTSHGVDPAAVIGLARDLFGAEPRGYIIGIRGYEFDAFGERLSEQARANLEAAREFLTGVLARRDAAALDRRCGPERRADRAAS